MQTTAREIAQWANEMLTVLASMPGASRTGTYREIAKLAGLSQSMVRQFHEQKANLTVDSLDKIVGAIKERLRKVAA